MIKFKCMYCGQKLKGKDSCLGKKLHCIKCGHVIRATSANIIKDKVERPKYEREGVSATLENHFRTEPWTKQDNDRISFWRRILVPQFDELTLFLMSVITVLLLATNRELQLSIFESASFAAQFSGLALALAVTIISGIALSIYHVFTRRQKSYVEKMTLAAFAVAITAISGICAGWYMLKSCAGWELIFPVWNLVNAIFIIILFRLEYIDEDCIADKDATAGQVLLGSVILLVVFLLCQYVFKTYWAVTMSVCVAYSTNFTFTPEYIAESDEDNWE